MKAEVGKKRTGSKGKRELSLIDNNNPLGLSVRPRGLGRA